MMLVVLGVAEWAFTYALETAVVEIPAKIFWAKLEYIGAQSIPVLLLIFALHYSQHDNWLKPRNLALLWIAPVATITLASTNEQHSLIWSAFSPSPVAGSNELIFHHGFAFWVSLVVNYTYLLIAIILFVTSALQLHKLRRYQVALILVIFLIPWLGNLIYLLNWVPIPGFNIPPFTIAISGILIALAIYWVELSDLFPVTRSKLLDIMQDAVIVLDNKNRIVDHNPAAETLIGLPSQQIIGKQAWQILIPWPYLVERFGVQSHVEPEETTIQDCFEFWYDLRISHLADARGQPMGWLVELHDITQDKQTQVDLEKQAYELQTVAEISVAIALTLDVHDLLQNVVDLTKARFRLYHSQVYLCSEGEELLVLASGSGDVGKKLIEKGYSIPIHQKKSLVARVARTRQGVLANNVDSDPNFLPNPLLPNTHAEMAVPIIAATQLLGVLDVQSDTYNRFTEQDINILTTLAAQIAVTIENARTFAILREQQIQLHEAMQVARLVSIEIDPITLMTTSSSELFDLMGTSGATEGGTQMPMEGFLERFVYPDDRQRWKADILAALNAPEDTLLEREVRFQLDGEVRYMLSQTKFERDIAGQAVKITGILQDITEQEQARTEIARLVKVIEQASETIVLTDRKGQIVYVNPQFEASTGYTTAEVLGQNPRLLRSGKQDPEFYRNLWETIAAGQTWQGTFINRRKDGILYHEAGTIFPIKNPSGEITHFAAVKRDITSQVLAENALRESERRYRLLADNAIDVIWTMDFTGKFNYVSPSVELLVGFTPEEILKKSFDEILTPSSAYIAEQNLQKVIETIQSGTKFDNRPVLEIELVCKNESTVWAEVSTAVMVDDDELPVGVLGVAREITVRKKREHFLNTLNNITRAASETTELSKLLQIMVDNLAELSHADGCYITLWDEEKNQVLPGVAYGPMRSQYQAIKIQTGEPSLTVAVLQAGRPLVLEDTNKSPLLSQNLAARLTERSLLGLPLVAGEIKLGAALIGFNQKHTFSEQEISICSQAAGQIGLAISKVRALETAQRRAHEAETLQKAGATVASTLSQKEAVKLILEQLNAVVPYDSSSVLLLRGDSLEVVDGRGFPNREAVVGLRFPIEGENPSARVFKTRRYLILKDAPSVYSAFLEPPHSHIHGWLGVPLIVQDHLIGMITLDSFTAGTFTNEHARLASAFADQVAVALENARLYAEVERLATTDSLTDLNNRRYFFSLARAECERARRFRHPYTIIMLDIDHFKRINDTYGHATGDRVLQCIAGLCRDALRRIDILGRYGGEEFVMLLPETDLKSATLVAERLRQNIVDTPIDTEFGRLTVAASLGVSTSNFSSPSMDECQDDLEKIIDQADQALYWAKQHGRNQVSTWEVRV